MENTHAVTLKEFEDDQSSSKMDRQSSEDFSGSDYDISDSELARVVSRDPRMEKYADLSETQQSCLNFAMENRIFLRAIFGLLAERDKKATEIGMNDPNTLKIGPLKKASVIVSGVWKVKFVEIRRGMFSYYEDSVSGDKVTEGLLRKNLPLDANTCSCRPVKIHRNGLNMAPVGSIFELKIDGNRRLWLAKSRAERAAWIQVINDAMVGGSVTQGDLKEQHGKSGTVNRRSPYQKDLKQFLKTKNNISRATTKYDYTEALRELRDAPLEIPVQWLMEQIDVTGDTGGAFSESELSSSVDQLWRDLRRDTLKINEEIFHGNSGHGPEKIIGALSRYIIALSQSSSSDLSAKYRIPESKAIGYARDILLSVNRTRSGGDSYYCIDTLCKNPDLIVTVPSSREAEPLSITIEVDNGDNMEYSTHDKSGWVRTRNRLQKASRKRFFVLSEGTLSLYRNASPRPHGLRGQTIVTGATITVNKSKDHEGLYTLYIETKDGLKDRWLYFSNKYKLLQWAYTLELTAKGNCGPQKNIGRPYSRGTQELKDATLVSLSDESDNLEKVMNNHAARIGMRTDEIAQRMAQFSARNISRVKIFVKASVEYNVSTVDPQGDESDTWATISASFLQTFRISSDRIARGEELVQVEVTKLSSFEESAEEFQTPVTPSSPRKKLGIRTRLKTS